MTIDPRLEYIKNIPRAMQSYVLTIYELVYELKPKIMLEIGVLRGQSTRTILMALEALKNGQLVSIDHKRRNELLNGEYDDLIPYWQFIRGNSHDPAIIESAKAISEQYDILFIDGDHSYEGVKQDFDNYTPLLKPGGLVLMHDVTNRNEGVKDFWLEITWDKFVFNWGRARGNITPGFGFVRKPL